MSEVALAKGCVDINSISFGLLLKFLDGGIIWFSVNFH